ncbi:MAG: hypothetical protein ACTS4V_01420 [Candidatus Hodgkinia cicadicola]
MLPNALPSFISFKRVYEREREHHHFKSNGRSCLSEAAIESFYLRSREGSELRNHQTHQTGG